MMRVGDVYQSHADKELYRVIIPDAQTTSGVPVVVYQNMHVDKPQVLVVLANVFHATVTDSEGNKVPSFRRLTADEMIEMVRKALQEREMSIEIKPARLLDAPKDGNIAGINPSYYKN